jgi:uncharacterized protein
MNSVKTIVLVILIIYVTCIILLYLLQAKLIFFPEKLPPTFKYTSSGTEIFLETSDHERINALFFRGTRSDVILYCHGNAGSLDNWQFVAEDFYKAGYSILIFDYRGYGKSSGRISEEGFYHDVLRCYDYLREYFQEDEIVVYGRSIGTGVAVDLCSKTKVKGLVLEAPYTSLVNLAKEKFGLFLPGIYLKTRFNNMAKINQIECPVLLIHGTEDSLIPARESQMLFNTFNGRKKLILVKGGGHNDLSSFVEYQKIVNNELPIFFEQPLH